MNKRELIEKRLIDCLDSWARRFRINLENEDEWEKNNRRAYDKIKEIVRDYCATQGARGEGEALTACAKRLGIPLWKAMEIGRLVLKIGQDK